MKLLNSVDLTDGSTIEGTLIAKLTDIPNSFTQFSVDGSLIQSDTKSSAISLVSGTGIKLTPDDTGDSITFSLVAGISDIDGLQSALDSKPDKCVSKTEIEIDTATETTVATYTPVATGNFLVYVYFRVANADTKISIKLYYNDAGGSQNQVVIDNSVATTIGSYSISPIFINSTATPITIAATSEHSSNLFVSTSVVGL